MDDRVKLKVMGITYSQIQNGAYALVLAEENGDRRIPIIIGTAEAQSIAIRLEHLTPPRPMTHDLFASFAQGFGIRLREVFVYHYEDGVFSSELLFDDGTRQIRIDSRTSDAIAIALRTQSPIYTTEKIISEAGIIFQEEPKEKKKEETKTVKRKHLNDYSTKELKERLEEAVRTEAYEKAALIQQELKKREQKQG
ncbi:bifunctional nuclease family protein [Coprobacter fastidiosus]|jgi:bifunctional DNase/RNase|uniref:bifunctional nuclease family protein n=1 Tax=Coprobacter fastidiosus TaxID=1099853 RepID=UPI0026700C88|nr:bifunctional nuclease family protein [Coprobacter fastidiosus]